MAAPVLKAKLTLDRSPFEKGLKAAKGAAVSFGSGLGSALKNAITSPVSQIGGLLAGAFSVGKFAEGIKGALDLGSEMENLKARTGEAVGNLLIFKQVLKSNNVDAEEAGPILNKMQKSIEAAAESGSLAYENFGRIGVSMKQLAALSPVEQFRAIHDAIAAIHSPAMRAAAAIKIFGKSGGQLMGAHFDAKGFEDAAKSLGRQTQILAANSKDFALVGERLERAGMKIQGFFIGAASTLLPALLKFSGLLDAGDLESAGEKFGAAIEGAVELVAGAFLHPEKLLSAFWNFMVERQLEFWNKEANFAVYSANLVGGAIITAFGEGVAFLGAGIEWAVTKGINLFSGGMGDAIGTMATKLITAYEAAVDFLIAGVKAAWEGGKNAAAAVGDALHKAVATIAPKGERSAGDGFKEILARYQSSDLIAMGKNMMGAKIGNTDFFGAEKFRHATKEAIDAMKEAGRLWIEGRNKVSGAKTGFDSNSTLSRSDTGGLFGATMQQFGEHMYDVTSPGFLGQFGTSLNKGAFNQSPLLNARERRGFEDAAVARGERTRTASAGAYNAVRSGDHKRAKEFAKNEAKKALTVQGTNERLDKVIGLVGGINKAFQ